MQAGGIGGVCNTCRQGGLEGFVIHAGRGDWTSATRYHRSLSQNVFSHTFVFKVDLQKSFTMQKFDHKQLCPFAF